MIEKYNLDVYLILTSEFDISDKKDPIGKIIWKRRMIDRVYSLHRVPNRVHAALYHNAACTLHPSFTEGGVGSYPFLEGMVMGTPGLVAEGEYSREGFRLHPNYNEIFMSATSRKKAAAKIADTLADREGAYKRQKPIFDAHNAWQWEDVARVYADSMFRAAGAGTPTEVTSPLYQDGKHIYFESPTR
jgi:glycosyltransferase involved in cell wall biosynthesis